MEHIIELNRNKKLKIPLSKCLENFTELNENMGYLDEYKSNYNLNKENNNCEVEKYFEEIEKIFVKRYISMTEKNYKITC